MRMSNRLGTDRSSMAPGTSSLLRARRRDANLKPNRVLDNKSSRGMIYENEELRLRTININAELEKGHTDIKKLRRENDQLRREIWNLRDEYDRLEALLKAKQGEEEADEEEAEDEEEEEEEGEESAGETTSLLRPQAGDSSDPVTSLAVESKDDVDGLSVVEEEPEEESADDRPRAVCFSDDRLSGPGGFRPGVAGSIPEYGADDVVRIPVPSLDALLRPQGSDEANEVIGPGGAEVVTTAILQRRQSYSQSGSPTGDTVTCTATRHTSAPGDHGARQCEAYTGPAPSFLRLNSVQPFTIVFPITDPLLQNLSVQEVIDGLSEQLGPALTHSLRGVRLVGGSCYLSFSSRSDADAALLLGLRLRAVPLAVEDASAGATVLSMIGVPHDLPDSALEAVLAHFGSLVGPVERRLYRGVDTGERVVRVRVRLAVPRWVWLDGCRVRIKVLRDEDISFVPLGRRKSFRSHISVQLRPMSEDCAPSASADETSLVLGSAPSIPMAVAGDRPPPPPATSLSTPNIFQESPFTFPSPFKATTDLPGLRRINSVLGTMSLGDTSEGSPRSPPPSAASASTLPLPRGETSAPPSPNTKRHKPPRKISKVNGETSSSDQDSPQKPGRRRPSSVYFKQKPPGGILNRNVSVDNSATGYEATSERERSNSDLSSRLSICRRKLSTTGRESGKVPWCGCWGNGCL